MKIRAFNPVKRIEMIYNSRDLIKQLTKRDLLTRYKGSSFGFAWAVITPLVMLFVYSFIFIVVFKMKWEGQLETSNTLYTLMIFSGLIPFYIFSESINRACSLISSNSNYVKKVVIPLESLPISMVISNVINHLCGLGLLVIGKIIFLDTPNWTLIYIPFLLLPLLLLTLGLSLAFSAIGTYVRDLSHTMGLVLNVMFYMSPIFYQIDALPENFRIIVNLNPLTPMIEQWRDIILLGKPLQFLEYAQTFCVAVVVLFIGYSIFNFLRKGFSDVV